MKLALIQEKQNALYRFNESGVHLEEQEIYSLQREMAAQNFELIREATKRHADIAVTSEAINFPGQPFWSELSSAEVILKTQSDLMQKCAQLARTGKLYVVTGMLRVKEDGRLYNSAVVFNRSGEIVFTYDKNFLTETEREYMTAGENFPVWNSEFGRIGIGICWDMQFPETARIYAIQEADMILCPTWGWEEIYGRSRAYENGVYVASAMAVPEWSGIERIRTPSQVIAPDGSVIAEGRRDRAEVVMVQIRDIRDCRQSRAFRISELSGHLSTDYFKQ